MGKNTASGGAAARRASRHSEPTPSDKTIAAAAAASTPASGSLRRTGRNATPVVDAESNDKIQSGAKTAPARSRRPSSTPAAGASGSKAPATTGGQKRSRLARASGPVNGSESRSLRKRGSVSFRETSDDEDDEDRSSSESEQEIIDDTIYEVPPEAILPEVTILDLPNPATAAPAPPVSAPPVAAEAVTGEEAMDIAVAPPLAPAPVAAPVPAPSAPQQQLVLPTAAMGELTAAYALLRSFSWQLRLAPFSFEDFCAAMSAVHPTVLMDEIHVCVLRALAFDEVEEEREERKLDLGMLDALTWPCYVWEMLRLTADPLAKYEWSQRLLESIVPTTVVTANAVPAITPAPEQPRQIIITPVAVIAAEDGGGQVKAENEAQPMEIDVAAPAVVMAGAPSSGLVEGGVAAMEPDAPAPASAVAAAVASHLPQTTTQSQSPLHPRPRAFEPVDIAQMDQQLAAAPTTETAAAAIQMFSSCAPAVHQRQNEYYSLPLETKAAILSRLCDHLLDCTTFRAEIDRREEENTFVGGRGDEEGGFFTRFPIAERERIAKTLRAGKGDSLPPPDTEACVICGVGGNLHLCDGCPAAFHQRCIGERSTTTDGSKKKGGAPPDEPKEKPEEPWYCPECILGGRGETAGVRIPVAARNKWKQPLHIINGAVVCTQLPAVQSQGRHLKELSATAPVTVLTGPAAAEALAASRKVRDTDEFPFPSSFETVKVPPQDLPVNRLPDGTLPPPPPTGPEAYTNKYRNAWTASSIALRATIEEFKRKKTKGKLTIPTGTCGRLIVSKLPEQMPLSKFQWFQMQGRPGARTTTRCGKCHTCLKTSLRKGCMNPVVRPLEDVLNSTYSPDTSKLSYLIAYVCKVEREFWAVIEGPWASEPGGGMQFRAQWSTIVRNASTVSDLAQSLLQLESLIRPVAFDPSWFGKSGTGGGGSGGSSSQPGSRGISRSGSMMDVQGGSAGAGPSSQPQQAAGGDDGDDGSGTKNKSTGDPYDIRTEKVIKAEWEMNRRSHAAHVASVNRLPLSLLRKAARHGGRQPIPGVQYKKREWKLVSPRLAWIAEMEAVQTCAQLALAIRKLDAVLNWEGIVKPKGLAFDAPFANAAVQAKRPVGSSGSSSSTCEYEYLIDMRQPMNPKEQEMFQKQQQALATIFQQRMAGAEAQVLMAQKQQQQQQQQQQPQTQHPGGPLAGVSPAFLAGGAAAANAAAAVAAAGAPGRLGSLNTGFVAPPIVPPFAGAALPPRPPLPSLPKQQEQTAPAAVAGNALPVPMVATAAAAAAMAAQQQQLLAGGLPLPGPFLSAGFSAFAVPPMAPTMPLAITMAQPPLPGLVTAPAVPAPVAAVAPVVVKKPAEMTEDQKISRQIVETAIKKAIEADLLHMPAAMAAKFRRKQSVGGDSTTESGAPAAVEDTKPTRTTAPAAGVFPPGMMPFFGAPGLFARPPMFGPPPPTWIHEREIPLWYIRSYEELCRREAANVAARELQAAARRGSTMDGAIKDAARKAAQVAAQAAADACGICYAAQGDNPELDALWICCDTCNRWFHGACVAMEPEDVNTIAEDEQWDCPGCANARRKAERAARREGKTLPSTFSPMEADAAAKKSGGRASKPFYEYADYKAGEAKMLEKLRRGEPIDGSGSRGKKRSVGGGFTTIAGETAEEATNRLAARTEYKKRKREEEARLAAEPIHCPVCQYPDFGRALVECDACRRWFHYECVGTAVDEVEAAMADEQQLRCAECQGKRVRPPTQAAIDAAILAAADMKSVRKKMRDDSMQPVPLSELGGGGGGGSLPGLFQQGAASPAPEVISQGPGGRSFNWRDAVNKIVVKTMRHGVAGPFCRPVSLEDAPDYNEFVKQPMDLDTLHSAIPRLRSPLDVLAGVNLIVDNCILYNGEGSDFAAAAVDMQRSFLKLWGAKGMPLTAEQWEAMLAGESSRPPRAAPNSGGAGGSGGAGPSGPGRKSTGGGGGSARKKSSFAASLAALSPAPNAHPAYDWRLCAAKALKQLAKLEVAEPFLEPVPFDVEDYHDVITHPMDIGTIQQRLSKGLYSDPSEVAADVAQIWTNCRTFNEPKAPIVADAAEAEEAFIQFWIAEEVYESVDPRSSGAYVAPLPGSGNAFRPTGPAAGASGSKPPPSAPQMTIVPDWQEAARKVLYRMINFTSSATWFITPVSAEDVPDYHQIIKNPMDLSTVLEKIKSGEYATPDEVVADVELIWKNAAAYNGLDHPVTKAAAQAREAFIKLWNTAGLDPEGQQQRLQMLEQRQQQIRQTQEQARLARQQSLAAAAAASGRSGGGGNASASAPLYDTQQDWVSAVRRVLSGIMNTTSCAPFNGPVSEDAHPEYSHVIEVHMDFGQILRNLGRGRYGNAVQVMQDIRLLFNNWRIYGEQTGDDTYATAGLEVAKQLFQAWQGEQLPVK